MIMDHAEARELFEIAAVEPDGLDRLMAGDTPEAARLAGHLADCPACGDELMRVRRVAAVVREVVRDLPPADLRERTLARVAAVGRPRGPALPTPTVAWTPTVASTPAVIPVPAVTPVPDAAAPRARERAARAPSGSLRTIASVAAVLIAVIGTGVVVSAQRDAEVASQAAALARADQAVTALAKVSAWSMRVSAEDDAAHVVLTGVPGEAATGTILFAPSTGDLVVVVSDLAEPPEGQEYRCWVDAGGERRPVGRMFFGGGLAYWVGPVEALADVRPGTTFGITLVDADGPSLADDPVLLGTF